MYMRGAYMLAKDSHDWRQKLRSFFDRARRGRVGAGSVVLIFLGYARFIFTSVEVAAIAPPTDNSSVLFSLNPLGASSSVGSTLNGVLEIVTALFIALGLARGPTGRARPLLRRLQLLAARAAAMQCPRH